MSAGIDMTRADRVAAALDGRAALLVTDLVDIRWLTGFTGSNAVALVGAAGERLLLTDFRYLSQVEAQVDAGWERLIRQDLLASVADALPTGRSGFDEHDLSVHQHQHLLAKVGEGVELEPAGSIVKDLRAIKDEAELVKLRAVAKVADEAFEEVVSAGLVGRTERDVALDLEIAMRRRGADGVSFPPIIAAGEHGALPHAEPRDVPIPANTLVVIDWGAQMDGYASDCTRTVATGPLDPRDRAVYDTVLAAQEAALAAVRPGPTGREVDAVARTIIDEAGHAEHFGHGLGHGVGLEVHEGPRLSKQGEVALAPGHVVTVEPGIYVPGAVGVRIEDLVAVTEGGHEVLSSLPKALRTVD
ncbi:M24 family metallopeptidase [Conexibacter sp. W3-3-2]|uniref:Aminopeptidase P family protein n=1 Tax=Paraconexibacter algicola TaxID=2133960 RepID=A0A2T4UC32_9ACTN|nr:MULTISPECIES: Xaa-Pro peptidase family protein [Solirubrobacterales]MTD42998.1 M24 family metallopeptidase [Conexibacter sp. W3-3-2]PTL54766.1 aminopeptidase P family protein [Paraconexibacter algicola]